MLLQEHVSVLLRPNISPGWEEEMDAAGLVSSEDGSAVLEDEEDAESDKSDDMVDISVGSVSSDKS
jgi:hypothetical protein